VPCFELKNMISYISYFEIGNNNIWNAKNFPKKILIDSYIGKLHSDSQTKARPRVPIKFSKCLMGGAMN
jgi:hypothetical protein